MQGTLVPSPSWYRWCSQRRSPPRLTEQKPTCAAPRGRRRRSVTVLATLMLVAAALVSTILYAANHRFTITTTHMPAAAVDILSERKAQRIFNAYQFGGYLIARDIPVFIDGRAELYGEQFVMDFFSATEAKKLDNLTRLLDDYRIDATLLTTGLPAAQVLDHLKGWKRLYADDIAVIHVRDDRKISAAPETPQ